MNFPNASSCSNTTLPSLEYYINPSIKYGMTPFNNISYDAMVTCCAPNDVNLILGCTLWCELPEEMLDEAERSGLSLLSPFSSCLKREAREEGAIMMTGTSASAGEVVRAPRVRELGVLGLMVSGFMLAM